MFEEHIVELAAFRNGLAIAKSRVDDARKKWEEENADLLADYATLKDAVAMLEESLRAAVVKCFNETGSKKPHPKLGIREGVQVLYDEGAITAYAKEQALDLLVLDGKKFEKYVRALAGDNLILGGALGQLVTFEKVPVATIAKNLED